MAVAEGRKDNLMTNKETVKTPIYVAIEDGDFETIRYYESHGIPVRKIAPHGTYHYYAIFSGETKEQADKLTNMWNTMVKNEYRSNEKYAEHNVSYDALVEDGYEAPAVEANPADIVADRIEVDEMRKKVEKLTEEEQRICRMIGEGKSEREMAKEMGIPRSTLNEKKTKILKKLR